MMHLPPLCFRRAAPTAVAVALLLALSGCGGAGQGAGAGPRDVTQQFRDYPGKEVQIDWMGMVNSATIQPSGQLDVRTSLSPDDTGRAVGSLVSGYGGLFAADYDQDAIHSVVVRAGDGSILATGSA